MTSVETLQPTCCGRAQGKTRQHQSHGGSLVMEGHPDGGSCS
eukprot:CAMPEP_0204584642 /NCGR_PEP_ID=MMETSP0661-20131031/46459_1 /ASSEMBLY_ACC=CAM_ASM_000606 /TAXON_ID=109239 /ORGANISM="Alexandrium margalefi, Strain AMGDE01CS-322" /LENGTH=41 /DNA_ID= /DNA_START= /DNA_END= /DNA_ORIENTATION=